MAVYLLPTNEKLSVCEKQGMFAVKNRMKNIPANFPKPNVENLCPCGKREDMIHIYYCELLNRGKQPELDYGKLYSGTILEQNRIFRYFESNFERRENLKHEIENKKKNPCDPPVIHCSQSSIVMG